MNIKDCLTDISTTDPVLEPCPFCKSNNLFINHYLTMDDREGWDYVTCRNCEADGPKARNELDAEKLWNKRQPK